MTRRLAFILTILFLAVFFNGGSQYVMASEPGNREAAHGNIEDLLKGSIAEQHDRLLDCRFEQPQAFTHIITRQNEAPAYRRTNDNTRTGDTPHFVEGENRLQHRSVTCSKAVAASRHIRGYYIYALRHIII